MSENEVQTQGESPVDTQGEVLGAALELNPLQQVQPAEALQDAATLSTDTTEGQDKPAPKKRGPKPGKKAAEREAAKVAAEQVGEDAAESSAAVEAQAVEREAGTLGLYKLDPSVPDLAYGTDRSACFDLRAYLAAGYVKAYSAANREYDVAVKVSPTGQRSILVPPGSRVLVPTGYIFDIPEGFKLEVYPRSGTALKLGAGLANSVAQIDEDYTNQTFILLANTSDVRVEIVDGDRIAQAAVEEVIRLGFQYITTPPQPKGDRKGGLGSTGVK